MTYMYGIAITYGVVSLLLLGGFAYITFKMTSKKWNAYYLYKKESFFEDYSGSINDLNKALSINPQLADAYQGRGIAQLLIGENDKACDDFKKALSFNNKTLDLFKKYCNWFFNLSS